MAALPIAIITGASSGIGAALAREAAEDGYQVVLVARRKDRMVALAETVPDSGGAALVPAQCRFWPRGPVRGWAGGYRSGDDRP